MVITFYGEGCFKIQSGELVILTDPFVDSKIGLNPPRLKADIILKTLTALPLSFSNASSSEALSNYQLICGPGEYNIKNITITGFSLPKESSEKFFKTIYLLEIEGINLCLLGHLSEIPEPTILEHLEDVDVLFVPAGGSPFLEQKLAVKIIKQLQPKIVIPSFFKIPSLKRPADKLEKFLEEFNGLKAKELTGQEKLVIKKKDLADFKKTEVAVLRP